MRKKRGSKTALSRFKTTNPTASSTQPKVFHPKNPQDRTNTISDDDESIKQLLNDTLALITDERVRLFCVAAQVIDVEAKINESITETLRLGKNAVKTAVAPLPGISALSTPIFSTLLCKNVLTCFGFLAVAPEKVEAVMKGYRVGEYGQIYCAD